VEGAVFFFFPRTGELLVKLSLFPPSLFMSKRTCRIAPLIGVLHQALFSFPFKSVPFSFHRSSSDRSPLPPLSVLSCWLLLVIVVHFGLPLVPNQGWLLPDIVTLDPPPLPAKHFCVFPSPFRASLPRHGRRAISRLRSRPTRPAPLLFFALPEPL